MQTFIYFIEGILAFNVLTVLLMLFSTKKVHQDLDI
jgi:hypothetical protein